MKETRKVLEQVKKHRKINKMISWFAMAMFSVIAICFFTVNLPELNLAGFMLMAVVVVGSIVISILNKKIDEKLKIIEEEVTEAERLMALYHQNDDQHIDTKE